MAESGPDIGATLRETRMRARIDIGEVEMRTKIRAKYLRAIENEEWDLLPGTVYVKSFLRTYADYLGLDSRLLLDEYKRRYELAPDAHGRPLSAVKRERERSERRPRGPLVPAWAIVVLVLVAAGVGLYLIGQLGNNSSTPKAAERVKPVTTPTVHTTAVTHPTATTSTTAAAPTEATLKLVPTGAVWVCVETPAGAKLIDGVVETVGANLPALKGSELLVRLGNANMTITANGKPHQLAASSTPISFKVTPKGVSALPEGPICA